MLGVCLGHQAIAESFGGKIIQSGYPIHGKVSKINHFNTKLFNKIKNPFNATRYHSLIIKKDSLPDCLRTTASVSDGTIMAIEHKLYQFLVYNFTPKALPQIMVINYLKIF